MKNLLKIGAVCTGLLLSFSSIAGVGQFENEKTTCYVLKNNKLVKKAICTYEGSSGAAASGYAIFEATFNVKGYGKIDIVDNWSGEDDGNGGWKNEKSTTTIDSEKAIQRNRDAKTLKILTQKQAENMSSDNSLTCYTNKKTTKELCYLDNTPR